MAIKKETELYAPVKSFFAGRGYEVKAEVLGCDLVAVRPDAAAPVIVEMKKTFSLPLLLQGIDRQRTGAEVWLAVERNRTKKGAHNQRFAELSALCRRLSLGFMTVTFYKTKAPVIEVWCEPGAAGASSGPPARPRLVAAEGQAPFGGQLAAEPPLAAAYAVAAGGRKRSRAAKLLKEFAGRSGDYNVGGSTGRKLVTAYRERALQCALALHCRGELPPREIGKLTGVPNAGLLLRDNHYGWFRRVSRGVYGLTDAGRAALGEYEAVAAVWAARFEWAAGWLAADETAAGSARRARGDGEPAAGGPDASGPNASGPNASGRRP